MQLLPRSPIRPRATITWDGVDLAQATRESAREQIVVLPQDTFILNLTLYDNILVGRAPAAPR